MPGDALLIEMPQCAPGALLILGDEVPERPLCDSMEVLITGDPDREAPMRLRRAADPWT